LYLQHTSLVADVIITRHEGALRWLEATYGGFVSNDPSMDPTGIPILASASYQDVRNKIVVGNLPLHLASQARAVNVIEFSGAPPRGSEYTAADMERAGAHLASYKVQQVR